MVKLQEKLDRTFSALSDSTRRAILFRLRRGPRTVSELASPFGMSLAAVSKHLKVLESAQLIQRQRQGRQFLIRLTAGPLDRADQWLQLYREFWEGNLDRLSDYVNQKNSNKGKRDEN